MEFASYLAANNAIPESESLVIELARGAGPGEAAYFLGHIDSLLGLWRFPGALAIWNLLCSRSQLPFSPLSSGGNLVTNGDFSGHTVGEGFDWSIADAPGVLVAPVAGGGWTIWLSGTQPEECELISQFLPLEPGKTYDVEYRCRIKSSRTENGPDTGVSWLLLDRSGNRMADSEVRGEEPAPTRLTCRLEAAEPGARLVLFYRRPAGSPRMEGEIRLERLSVELGIDALHAQV
jgi:hypothetical protein